LRELTRADVRALLAWPEELLAVWPDASGDRLDVMVPRHLERDGFRFVAEHDESGRLAGIAYGYRGGGHDEDRRAARRRMLSCSARC
jgi:hypothetical protein